MKKRYFLKKYFTHNEYMCSIRRINVLSNISPYTRLCGSETQGGDNVFRIACLCGKLFKHEN